MKKWYGDVDYSSEVHAIGNGNIIVYGKGPDMMQVMGPPYGSEICADFKVQEVNYCESERLLGTAIWKHHMFKDGQEVGWLTDFCGDQAKFVRDMDLKEDVTFILGATDKKNRIENNIKDPRVTSSIMLILPSGSNVFERIVSPYEQYLQVFTLGNARIIKEANEDGIKVICGKGKSSICFVGGHNIIECYPQVMEILNDGVDKVYADNKAYWENFTARLKPVIDSIGDVPQRDKLIEAIDSTAVIIKTQQCAEGGVLAGYYYHLVYVRDSYGVLKCLLDLGLFEEAKGMMKFYLDIFNKHGQLHNAQGPGVDGFHPFENEDTEILGYLFKSGWDYFEFTKDEDFLMEMLPMLKWAIDRQVTQLHKNMMPFNGDETYIAGGIYPRTAIDHGSAEATMLFIFSEDLLDWLDHKGIEQEWSRNIREKVDGAKAHYAENFIVDGKLYTNNPDRFEFSLLPQFRIGACVHPGCTRNYHWLERNSKGAYMCPNCYEEEFAPNMERHQVKSTNLLPMFFDTDLVPKEVILPMVKEIADSFLTSNNMTSKSDTDIAVGYDFGILLYNAVVLGLDCADELAEKVLDKIDGAGAWVEYYFNGVPGGCPYRPWESGINISALLRYAASKK